MFKFLLTAYLVSMLMYRIDFGIGIFSFRVTPALLMSLVIIASFFFRNFYVGNKFSFDGFSKSILLYVLLLLGYTSLTLVWGFYDLLQLKRLILFLISLFSSLCFIILFDSNNSKKKVLLNFIKYSVFIYILFCLVQIYYFIEGKFILIMQREGKDFLWGFINPYPVTIGPYFPRLTGGFIDPNLAGYALTILYFFSEFLNKRKYQVVLIILLILTISRSAIVGFLVSYTIYKLLLILVYKKITLNLEGVIFRFLKYFLFMVLIIFVLFKFEQTLKVIIDIRFGSDLASGSGKTHIALIEYAIQELKGLHLFFGYGFNSSFLFAQRFFSGNKYANFHSEYITFLFDEGIIGLIIYLVIYVYIFFLVFRKEFLSKKDLVLISSFLSISLFNIFYQQFIFNYYWTSIFLITYFLYSFYKSKEKLYAFNH